MYNYLAVEVFEAVHNQKTQRHKIILYISQWCCSSRYTKKSEGSTASTHLFQFCVPCVFNERVYLLLRKQAKISMQAKRLSQSF